MPLNENIRAARDRLGLSRAELAARVGVALSTISLYEQGRREPSLGILVKLAAALSCTTDELLDFQPDEFERYKNLLESYGYEVSFSPVPTTNAGLTVTYSLMRASAPRKVNISRDDFIAVVRDAIKEHENASTSGLDWYLFAAFSDYELQALSSAARKVAALPVGALAVPTPADNEELQRLFSAIAPPAYTFPAAARKYLANKRETNAQKNTPPNDEV